MPASIDRLPYSDPKGKLYILCGAHGASPVEALYSYRRFLESFKGGMHDCLSKSPVMRKIMKQTNTKKLAVAAVFCAVAVVGSLFSFPVFGSKCSPVQHMVNILCAVLLGPGYGLGAAFAAALIRNLLGLGSLMAFPGSMFGALLCGLVYQKTQNIPATLIGEVFGTSILGGLTAYPVAIFLMGKSAAGLAFYAYVIPFLVSTAGGAVISGVLIYSLKKANILAGMQEAMGQ